VRDRRSSSFYARKQLNDCADVGTAGLFLHKGPAREKAPIFSGLSFEWSFRIFTGAEGPVWGRDAVIRHGNLGRLRCAVSGHSYIRQ
jgi:hypothetical protein